MFYELLSNKDWAPARVIGITKVAGLFPSQDTCKNQPMMEWRPVIGGLPVQSLVWVHTGGNQLMFLSLPSSFFKSSEKNVLALGLKKMNQPQGMHK